MRLHKGWLDQRHSNSERSHLIAQSLTEPLKGVFARCIHAYIWGSDLADH
jgi:hypothetical protein